MDDDINVAVNPTLYSAAGVRDMWFVPTAAQQYYPVTYSTFWIERRLWGLGPRGYHVSNVLWHAASVVLLWRLLLVLRLPGAWLAAAIFAVHSVEVESVAWIAERKNVVSLPLALLSMLAYLRFEPAEADASGLPRFHRWRWYAASLALFALALFAKTVVVTLPAVLLVIYWWRNGRLTTCDLGRTAPFFVLAVALGSITFWVEKYHVGAQGKDWSLMCSPSKSSWPAARSGFTPASSPGLTRRCSSTCAGRSTPGPGGSGFIPARGGAGRSLACAKENRSRPRGGRIDLRRRADTDARLHEYLFPCLFVRRGPLSISRQPGADCPWGVWRREMVCKVERVRVAADKPSG